MPRATASGTVANLTFDALGRFKTRVLSTNPVTTDTYAYLDAQATVAEISTTVSGGATTTTRALLDLTGARLALRVGATVSWTLFDPLGSLVGLVNPGRTLTDARRFDGYGETVASRSCFARRLP